MGKRYRQANALDLSLAIVADEATEAPPGKLRPTRWIEGAVDTVTGKAPLDGKMDRFAYGLSVAVGLPLALWIGTAAALRTLGAINPFVGRLAGLYLLRGLFTIAGTVRDAQQAEEALAAGDIERARRALPADAGIDADGDASEARVASAAIQSMVQRMTPDFVGPWFYYLLFGVPGALAYRTVDILHRKWNGRAEHTDLGQTAARLDYVVNYLPARLSALLLVAASSVLEENAGQARRRTQDESGHVEGSHSGWPLAAASGALNVRLEKPHEYIIGEDDPEPETFDVSRAIGLVRMAAAIAAAATAVIAILRRRLSPRD